MDCRHSKNAFHRAPILVRTSYSKNLRGDVGVQAPPCAAPLHYPTVRARAAPIRSTALWHDDDIPRGIYHTSLAHRILPSEVRHTISVDPVGLGPTCTLHPFGTFGVTATPRGYGLPRAERDRVQRSIPMHQAGPIPHTDGSLRTAYALPVLDPRDTVRCAPLG